MTLPDGEVYLFTIKKFSINMEQRELVLCKHCQHYKKTDFDNYMCQRKDVDGVPVCYDFGPDDWCKYGEKEEE